MFEQLRQLEVDDEDPPGAEFAGAEELDPKILALSRQNTARTLRDVSPEQDPEIEAPQAREAAYRLSNPTLFTPAEQRNALNELTTIPATAKLCALLDEYDYNFMHEASKVRNLVIAKLLEEAAQGRGPAKIRALELLGKIRGVDLFTERVESTTKIVPDDRLDDELRARLAKVITEPKAEESIDAELSRSVKAPDAH